MESKKKVYSKPELVIHGDVEEITQAGACPNADVPAGVNNAFSPGGGPCLPI